MGSLWYLACGILRVFGVVESSDLTGLVLEQGCGKVPMLYNYVDVWEVNCSYDNGRSSGSPLSQNIYGV